MFVHFREAFGQQSNAIFRFGSFSAYEALPLIYRAWHRVQGLLRTLTSSMGFLGHRDK